MQRLFSMFPAGRAGAALLLMRLALVAAEAEGGWSRLSHAGIDWVSIAAGVLTLALCVGILMPVACALVVVFDIATWATSAGERHVPHLCSLLGAIALFMLGPGAYSLDARLFGRRRVVIDSRRARRED